MSAPHAQSAYWHTPTTHMSARTIRSDVICTCISKPKSNSTLIHRQHDHLHSPHVSARAAPTTWPHHTYLYSTAPTWPRRTSHTRHPPLDYQYNHHSCLASLYLPALTTLTWAHPRPTRTTHHPSQVEHCCLTRTLRKASDLRNSGTTEHRHRHRKTNKPTNKQPRNLARFSFVRQKQSALKEVQQTPQSMRLRKRAQNFKRRRFKRRRNCGGHMAKSISHSQK
jgi:hypothetical protein